MIHQEKSPLAGKEVIIKGQGQTLAFQERFKVEDWWDRVAGKSWMVCDGNPACMIYGMKAGFNGLPTDNEVIYGKIDGLGLLVHVSEVIDSGEPTQKEKTV